jgi:halogenation protein CepH
MSAHPGSEYDVVVVGGGPAGSTTATYLAMKGYRVALLDKAKHPRYRVGESLLPSMMPILEDFGLLEKIDGLGFPRKTGGTFVWGKDAEPWDVLFGENPFLPFPYAYHVERSIYDKVLLDHSADQGVEVFENHAVLGPIQDDTGRVTGVNYELEDGTGGQVLAKWVVDASGPSSIIGRHVAKRHYDEKMRQVAFYTYYEDTVGPAEFRRGHVVVTSTKKGWFWWIPVDSKQLGATSVGLVTGQEFKDEYTAKGIEAFFNEALEETPQVKEMLGDRARRTQPLGAITDWAYACDHMAGPGYYMVGDAAAFLDPLLSTGVTMAMLAGYSASACIHTMLSEPATEPHCVDFYNQNYLRMWTVTRDFLHYFYAGNANAHPDELFWKARETLALNENVGAKQAFCFMVNTIPANPHPALEKQIHMFQQFMDHVEHPMEAMSSEADFQDLLGEAHGWVSVDELTDAVVPVVNGSLESSYRIDKDSHTLLEVRGVAYDQDRTVFSSTSSWLLGRNLYPLDATDCDLLALCDGSRTWAQIKERADGDGAVLEERLTSLHGERFVLLRGESANG